jgi:hypothetical protein
MYSTKGLETPLNLNENFGALIALRDYRDGTNIQRPESQ